VGKKATLTVERNGATRKVKVAVIDISEQRIAAAYQPMPTSPNAPMVEWHRPRAEIHRINDRGCRPQTDPKILRAALHDLGFPKAPISLCATLSGALTRGSERSIFRLRRLHFLLSFSTGAISPTRRT
jgi:hypothetical protein